MILALSTGHRSIWRSDAAAPASLRLRLSPMTQSVHVAVARSGPSSVFYLCTLSHYTVGMMRALLMGMKIAAAVRQPALSAGPRPACINGSPARVPLLFLSSISTNTVLQKWLVHSQYSRVHKVENLLTRLLSEQQVGNWVQPHFGMHKIPN